MLPLSFSAGFLLGCFLFLLYHVHSVRKLEKKLQESLIENSALQTALKGSKTQEDLLATFSNTLVQSSKSFLKEIQQETKEYFSEKSKHFEEIISPVHTTLTTFKQRIELFEKNHAEDRGSLKEQISLLLETGKQMQTETNLLRNVLAHPAKRGRWGEIQLERILELSGMLKYCDFDMQVSSGNSRVDALIRLPKNRCLIIDSKAPFCESYLETGEYDKDSMVAKIKDHMKALQAKSYWDNFPETPEFVILFLPGESLFHEAVKHAPDLINSPAASNVLLTGPSTLLALLKTIAHTWKQENLQKQIQEIGLLGKELHNRLKIAMSHLAKVGKNLQAAVDSYNDMSASLKKRLLPSIKKFEAFHITNPSEEIPSPASISSQPEHFPEIFSSPSQEISID